MSGSLSDALIAPARWAIWLWQQPYGPYLELPAALVLFVAVFGLASVVEASDRERLRPKVQSGRTTLPTVRTTGSRPRGTVYIPLQLGPVTVDLQPRLGGSLHVGVGGVSGLGKSTSVLSLLDLDIGVLVVALDNTRPIRDKVLSVGGTDWTNDPRQCRLGLDMLNFNAAAAAELVVTGLPKVEGDSGQWRRAAIVRLMRTLEACDRAGIERNWPDLIRALWLKSGDVAADRACMEWASKLEQVYTLFGQSFGTDIDVVQAMRDRRKVLLRTNRFLHPESAPMIGGWLMVLSRLVATEAGVPFVLIVEEAGQAELFAKHISPIAQAARDRDVVGIWIGQNLSKLPDEVTQNTKVWVCFGQELEREQRFAASILRLHPSQLYLEAFPKAKNPTDQGLGWCYVRAPGLPTTMVHLPAPASKTRALTPRAVGSSVGSSDVGVPRWEVVEYPRVNGWRPWQEALQGPQVVSEQSGYAEPAPEWLGGETALERMWEQCKRSDQPSILWSPSRGVWYDERGCLEWTGTLTRPQNGAPARPRASLHRRHATPYIEFYRLAKGSPEPTIDHLCDNPICNDVDHLEAVSIAENNRRRAQRTALFELADWTRVEETIKGQRVVRWRGRVPAVA